MIKFATAQVWVHDQDEALAFYTQKLGFEVRSDVTLDAESSESFASIVYQRTVRLREPRLLGRSMPTCSPSEESHDAQFPFGDMRVAHSKHTGARARGSTKSLAIGRLH